MAEPAEYLVVALSGRALAVAARRSGRAARVLDLFGDVDTRSSASASLVVAGDLERGFDETALLRCAEQIAPIVAQPACGLVYGAGLEDRPPLLERLCRGRALYGNAPRTVAFAKNPRTFFPLLSRLGIPYPDTTFTARNDPGGWLAKRIGASGGAHVSPAALASGDARNLYYQRHVAGRPIGVSFLADGERAFVLGCCEQWTCPGTPASFRFGGAFQPAAIAQSVETQIRGLLDPLVQALGLVGLNSLDVIVDGDRLHVLEVNPRPGANLDIFDGADAAGLFAHHVRACAGVLPRAWQAPAQATATAVVYAEQPCRAPALTSWPDWVADRPASGASIRAGAPVCTVLAADPSTAGVRRLVNERVCAVLSALQPDASSHATDDDTAFAIG